MSNDYNDIDAILNIVNENRTVDATIPPLIKEENIVNNTPNSIQNPKPQQKIDPKKSIGAHKKTSKKKARLTNKVADKILLGASIFGILSASVFIATMDYHPPVNNTCIETEIDIETRAEAYINILKIKKLNELRYCGLIDLEIKESLFGKKEFSFTTKDTSITDYQKLNVTSETDLYILKQLLPNREFQKLQELYPNFEIPNDKDAKEEIYKNADTIIIEINVAKNYPTNYITSLSESDLEKLGSDKQAISFIRETLQKQKLYELINLGLAEIKSNKSSDNFTNCFIEISENSVGDYKQLNISNPLDIYIFKSILPKKEFNKFIQATTYHDGLRDCNYVDFNQFLRINGYINQNTQEPDSGVYENYMEAKILANMDQYISQLQSSGYIVTNKTETNGRTRS